jgi:prefoldin alpha subunit
VEQEQFFKLQMIEQEAGQINQQMEIVDQNISEMNDLKSSLEELEKSENKEILANLGKKIFIPVEIKKKELIVEVGNKNFVKKSIPETMKIVDGQIEKLNMLKMQLGERIEALNSEMNRMIMELNKGRGHKCNHDNCNCEEECDDCKCENEED